MDEISSRVAGNVTCTIGVRCDMARHTGTTVEQELHNAIRAGLLQEKLEMLNRIQNYIRNSSRSFDWFEDAEVGDMLLGGIPGVIGWNNQASCPFYEIDFGAGRPLRGILWNWQRAMTVTKGTQGGLDIYIDKSSLGHGSWKQPPTTWLIRRSCCLFGIIGSAAAVPMIGLRWPGVPVAIFGATMWALARYASKRARIDAEHAAKDFFDAIEMNAHRIHGLLMEE